MNICNQTIKELRHFLVLWLTQSLSTLGSSMTSFALVIWSYQEKGSALTTALLAVSSYAPYVLMSVFAGALSDRWNKRITMLVTDSFAAVCTVGVMLLLAAGKLQIWHLYVLNALNGLMNTIQQPASEVSASLLIPKKHYQKASGLRSFSNSLNSIVSPVAATALMSFAGIKAVIFFDLTTFSIAFLTLALLIKIPDVPAGEERDEGVLASAKNGLIYLSENRGILHLILFLAAINFTASIFNAAFPAMILSRTGGVEQALGMVNAVRGIAMMAGSLMASMLPPPRSRIRMICNTLLWSMSTENFILAFSHSVPVWCLAEAMGWLVIPVMNANLDVILRTRIPVTMQGRVYSARNTLQFFTIPLGYFVGGLLVDQVFEPMMAAQPPGSFLVSVFGSGKGSGAAVLFLVIGFLGMGTCVWFRKDRYIWSLEKGDGGAELIQEA